ncbi:polyphenol oxidase family protein, partial [Jannaschia sp. LMIT008]|uniref:polyphenol oxidase family protein n=1 Tax=Jannaschia maritima TaxID=3032585 RepID=UPI002810EC6A
MPLDVVTHPALAARHGFFARTGGASRGLYDSLNCGLGADDDPDAVRTNRSRVANALDAGPDALRFVHQVHSTDVVTVTGPLDAPRADAMVTDRPGHVLCILTADCQPVLFHDHAAGVSGAAHGGWRGTLDGVLEATVDAMRALGAADIRAVIGPCISAPHYE